MAVPPCQFGKTHMRSEPHLPGSSGRIVVLSLGLAPGSWIPPDGQPLKSDECNCITVVVSKMRLVCIIILSILLSCLSIQAHALEPGDIAEPSMSVPDMNMPVPSISGPASSVPVSVAPNMEMPKPEAKPLVEPDNNPVQTAPAGNISSNQTQPAQVQKTADVSGKWSIKFDRRTDRSLDLNLWSSSGNRILGYGTLTVQGAKYSVTASGSLIDQELILATQSATPEYATKRFDEYDLDLFMENNTLSGTYVLRSGGKSMGEGNATAVKQ